MGEVLFAVLFLALAAPAPAAAPSAPAPVTTAPLPAAPVEAAPSPQRVLALIRARFRSHRPPPPFETYTLTRSQKRANGTVDVSNAYTRRVWIRNADRAALTRLVIGGGRLGPLAFDRPAFNEPRDPGPPTADMFEPAPARPHGVDEAATPEPVYSTLTSGASRESDYRVDSLAVEGDVLHLRITPVRDVERNRLREVFADRTTYELRKLLVVDKLFITQGAAFPVLFVITMDAVKDVPVVTAIEGHVGGGFNGDGRELNYTFSEIDFPASLPEWYFDPRTYRRHTADAPL